MIIKCLQNVPVTLHVLCLQAQFTVWVFVYAEQGSRWRSGAPHRWLNDRTSHAGGTSAATCDFSHLVRTG